MANLPVEQQRIGRGLDGELMPIAECVNPWCANNAKDDHHIVRRSFLNGAYPVVEIDNEPYPNIAPVCVLCHDDLEQNRAFIKLLDDGHWAWYLRDASSYDVLDPHPSFYIEPEPTPSCPHMGMYPGEVCACGYRKPHPRKERSPSTKPYPVHIPVDEHETFKETLQATAEYIGVLEQPHFAWKAINVGLVRVLQDPELKDFWHRTEGLR